MARDAFNDQMWQQLLEAGPAIARAVAAAAGSASQSVAELESFIRLVETTAEESGESDLLGRLARDLHSSLAAGSIAVVVEDVIAEGIHAARTAGAILAVHPDEQQARTVRLWLHAVARTVAEAAREGGVLGLGGEDVSRPERETITAISDSLGLAEPAPESGAVTPEA